MKTKETKNFRKTGNTIAHTDVANIAIVEIHEIEDDENFLHFDHKINFFGGKWTNTKSFVLEKGEYTLVRVSKVNETYYELRHEKSKTNDEFSKIVEIKTITLLKNTLCRFEDSLTSDKILFEMKTNSDGLFSLSWSKGIYSCKSYNYNDRTIESDLSNSEILVLGGKLENIETKITIEQVKKLVKMGVPSKKFWDLWKLEKENIKSLGIFAEKKLGKFTVYLTKDNKKYLFGI